MMSIVRRFGLVLCAFAIESMAASPANALPFKAGDIYVDYPWARATAATLAEGAVYLTIENRGAHADRLISAAEWRVGRVELRESTIEGDTAQMHILPNGVEIPAGKKIEFRTDSVHLMLFDLKIPIVAGTCIPLTLMFEIAGPLYVEISVEGSRADSPTFDCRTALK